MKNDLYELTRTRRSVRRYGSEHIDDEIINQREHEGCTSRTDIFRP